MISTRVVSTETKSQAVINAQQNASSFLISHIMSIDRLWAIKARSSCTAGASTLSGVYLCHSFHRKMERQEMAGCCITYRGGYSCICFYSCFLASALLFGDTAVCTLAAEVPDHWRKKRRVMKERKSWKKFQTKGYPQKCIKKNQRSLVYIGHMQFKTLKGQFILKHTYFSFSL